MSRLSRFLAFGIALSAAGWIAGSQPAHVAGQAPSAGEGASDPAESPDPAGGDSDRSGTSAESAAAAPSGQPEAGAEAEPADAAAAEARLREANRQIEEALAKRVSFQFKDDRLRDVLAELARAGSFPLWIDEKALTDIGTTADEPLTVDLENVTLQQAFNRALWGRGLTGIVHQEVLRVTTVEEAEQVQTTKTYDVAALLDYVEDQAPRDVLLGQRVRKYQGSFSGPVEVRPTSWIVETVQEFTAGPWEDIDGTGGTISTLRDALIVRQTYHVQRETTSLLDALRAAVGGELTHGSREVRPENYPAAADRRIRLALGQKASFDFQGLPLSSVMGDIKRRAGAAVIVDIQALQDIGVADDQTVSLSVEGVTWRSTLELLLEPLGLTSIVEDGYLVITTIEEAETYLFTTVYDIRDLAERQFGGQTLLDAILNETSGPWEDIDGTGGAAAVPVGGILLIRQTQGVHGEIDVLLADLREHLSKSAPGAAEQAAAESLDGEAPSAVLTRFYPIDPLLATTASQDPAGKTAEPRGRPSRTALERTIFEFVAPESWTDAGQGGRGVLEKVNDVLVVRQTAAVHGELRGFLDRLENAAASAASLQGMPLQGFGGGTGGFGGGGGGFFRLPAPPDRGE